MQPDPRAHIQISATECRLNMSAGAALTNRSISAGHTLLPVSLMLGGKKKNVEITEQIGYREVGN